MKPKLGILSLGCPRNLVDAESIAGRLDSKGYAITQDLAQADVALVNTCAFIEDAKRESIDAILDLIDLKKQGKLKKIIVGGCLTQRYKDKLRRELPEIDAFVGSPGLNHEQRRFALTPRHYAYLKICEGCVNSCSYCVIPAIKGELKSLPESEVLRKVRDFNRQKIPELNIIGQDITGYGMDRGGKSALGGLLKKIVDNSSGIGWLRLLYLSPERLTDELLELVRSEKRICKYIDLPIQHIDDRILRLMKRRITADEIIALIAKIRKCIPGVALRTSVIVGFPSETEKDFRRLLEFVKEARFERLGAFIYSREEGTPAYNFRGQLSQKQKEERFDELMREQRRISASVNAGFLDKDITVLIEGKEGDSYVGRSEYDAPEVDGMVYIRSRRKLNAGEFVKAKITDTLEYDLVGEISP